MEINRFKVSTLFYFKSGLSKKVDWIEDGLVKRVERNGGEHSEPLEKHEAVSFFKGKFREWKENNTVLAKDNIKGFTVVVPFSEVEFATFDVEMLNEGGGTVEKETYDITSHPAYKK